MKLEEAQKVLDVVGQLTIHAAIDVQNGCTQPGVTYGAKLMELQHMLAEIVARDEAGKG